jgi:hypothetical protein
MKLNRILAAVFKGKNPVRAVVDEALVNPPGILKSKPSADTPVLKDEVITVERPLKSPAASANVEMANAGLALAVAHVAVIMLQQWTGWDPGTEVIGPIEIALAALLTWLSKRLRKGAENQAHLKG